MEREIMNLLKAKGSAGGKTASTPSLFPSHAETTFISVNISPGNEMNIPGTPTRKTHLINRY